MGTEDEESVLTHYFGFYSVQEATDSIKLTMNNEIRENYGEVVK